MRIIQERKAISINVRRYSSRIASINDSILELVVEN